MLSCALNYELNCIKTLQSHGEYFKSVCVVRFPNTCGYLMFNIIGLSSKGLSTFKDVRKSRTLWILYLSFAFCIYSLITCLGVICQAWTLMHLHKFYHCSELEATEALLGIAWTLTFKLFDIVNEHVHLFLSLVQEKHASCVLLKAVYVLTCFNAKSLLFVHNFLRPLHKRICLP